LTALLSLLAVPALADCPPTVDALGADPRLRGPSVLVVDKAARRIAHYEAGQISVRDGVPGCWTIALAPNAPTGPKRVEGDRRTPEGWYRISDKPTSQFPLALRVHYPNADDAAAALASGLIDAPTAAQLRDAVRSGRVPPQRTALGGEILIHGGGADTDWTLGCIAMDTPDLALLRARLPSDFAADLWIRP